VVLNETDSENRGAKGRPVLRLLRDYAWRYWWSYFTGAVFLWITNYLAVSIPGQIGHAIDALRADQPLGRYIAAIALMGVTVIVVRSLSRILIFNPGRHLEYHLRRDLFARLLRLQPSFYATQKRGDIVSRAANDISWVRTLVGFGGLQVVNVTIAVALTGWKMVALSPRLTLMVLLPIALGGGLVQWPGAARSSSVRSRNTSSAACREWPRSRDSWPRIHSSDVSRSEI
jgi:ATP-binding cassette subfamily B protein